jgi:hypothetical protein
LKRVPDARAFVEGDLPRAFAAKGIEIALRTAISGREMAGAIERSDR